MNEQRIERIGGEGGIRTLESGFGPINCLAGSPVRPLQHLSARWYAPQGRKVIALARPWQLAFWSLDTLHRQPKTCGPNNEHAADNINYAPACVCYRSSTYDPDDLFRLNQKIDPVVNRRPTRGALQSSGATSLGLSPSKFGEAFDEFAPKIVTRRVHS